MKLLRLPRRTVRLKLTLLYGGLFLVSGAVLLAITFVLVSRASAYTYNSHGTFNTVVGSAPPPATSTPNGPVNTQQEQHGQAGRQLSLGAKSDLTPQQQAEQAKLLQAQAREARDEQLRELVNQSGIALGIMAVVSIGMGWIVAGRVLRRLSTITATARDISATNLHERLGLDGPKDEVRELGDTIDALLARLEDSFDAQRKFIANASHELRTPLARQRTIAQVALADPQATVESLRDAHERVLAAGTQHEGVLSALLTLARGQAGLLAREPFDLRPVLSDTVEARHAEAAERGVTVRTSLRTAPTAGDPRLAEQLAGNLLDNALRHNVPGGHVEISTGREDDRAVLRVANTGPHVPPGDIERLFQAFQRLDSGRAGRREGLGLGLSIVRAIANAHDATVEAVPRPGDGLVVTVRFPPALSPSSRTR